uniref:Spartin-like n=1 Tax=Saccoglossus kowalevskii TaxID=10224 RepID=A0ABM0M6E5_SACKO|nr:PREDICTED: spartin-like [Saccoglossus kowalevskii]
MKSQATRPRHNEQRTPIRSAGEAELVKQHYEEAFALVSQALGYDEQALTDLAITFYDKALKSLAKGLDIPCDEPGCVGREWNNARSMQTKMKRMTVQMKSRLENLKRQRVVAPTAPPKENGLSSQMEINAGLMYDGEPPSYAESEASAEEIICIQEGVQIYFLNSQGHVSAPSAPGPLRIFKFLNQENAEGAAHQVDQPPAFIQVCDWVYPLVPGQSPALKSLDGSYLFPDVNAPEQGSYVGLILSTDVKRTQIETFEKMLVSFAAVGVQRRGKTPTPMRPPPPQTRPLSATSSRPERISKPSQTVTMRPTPHTSDHERPPAYDVSTSSHARRTVADDEKEEEPESLEKDNLPHWSESLSHDIIKGAGWFSRGLGIGAEAAGKFVHKEAAKLREQLQPNEQPTEVDPKYQKGLEYAKQATGVAVKVSGFLIDVLCDVTKKIGKEVGPVIRQEGEKYIPGNWKSSSDAESSDEVDGAIHVAASGLGGMNIHSCLFTTFVKCCNLPLHIVNK